MHDSPAEDERRVGRLLRLLRVERLVAAASLIDSTAYLVVLLGGDVGLRAGEMRPLRWTDADVDTGQLRVERQEWQGHISTTKGNRIRYVPMTSRLREALRGHRHLRGERVLYRADGRSMTESSLKELLARAARRANLQNNGPVDRGRRRRPTGDASSPLSTTLRPRRWPVASPAPTARLIASRRSGYPRGRGGLPASVEPIFVGRSRRGNPGWGDTLPPAHRSPRLHQLVLAGQQRRHLLEPLDVRRAVHRHDELVV